MIYQLNEMMEQLLASAVDEETGELTMTDEELAERMNTLRIEFDDQVDSLASEIKNLKAEAEAIKAEKLALADRQKKTENRLERMKRLMAYLLAGQKWKNGRHSISYRKSYPVVIDDGFLEWAEMNAPGLLKVEVSPRKDDIKKALMNGTVFEFAHLDESSNIQIK